MRRAAIALLAAAAAALAVAAREAPRKKLIEWGWDEPDTAFLRANAAAMERTPFDGCVYHVIADTASGPVNVSWRAWGGRAFGERELARAAEDLRKTRLVRFRANFLRMNVTPGALDWYDDHQALLANARQLARLSRLGRGAGIALDTEQYEGQLFDYARQRDAGRRSFQDYSAQARRRGRELMQAFEEGHPGLSVLLTFGASFVEGYRQAYGVEPERNSYALLVPFADGLAQGATRGRVVDGFELSYPYKQPAQFEGAYRLMRETGARSADPERYARFTSFGFGLWMDYNWRKHGWNADDTRPNYFQPEELYVSARAALRNADEFVWIYSEQPRWWGPGGRVKLPSAYEDALVRAKRDGAGRARRPR